MKLHRIAMLRRIALPILKRFSRDVDFKHPWIHDVNIRLNSFRHKGYWFHGRNREKNSMHLFRKLISRGSTVIEVGGHIGFISLYFASLVGEEGKVVVFEPGSNNLPYLRTNVITRAPDCLKRPIELVEAAVGSYVGTVTLHEDTLTGQNNSIVPSFPGLAENAEHAYVKVESVKRDVPLITIDSYIQGRHVDFIKIDVEGYEWEVLKGARETIDIQNVLVQRNL